MERHINMVQTLNTIEGGKTYQRGKNDAHLKVKKQITCKVPNPIGLRALVPKNFQTKRTEFSLKLDHFPGSKPYKLNL